MRAGLLALETAFESLDEIYEDEKEKKTSFSNSQPQSDRSCLGAFLRAISIGKLGGYSAPWSSCTVMCVTTVHVNIAQKFHWFNKLRLETSALAHRNIAIGNDEKTIDDK